ncbi:MAG: methyltransferase domain-containing protein, partial [Gemmatimonadota bacterium]
MTPPVDSPAGSPDSKSAGFLRHAPDPMRYGHQNPSPDECDGLALAMIPRGARVLDVGCGIGDFSARVRDSLGASVVGVELDGQRAAQARDRGLIIHEQDLAEIPTATFGPFDVILYMDVLEHLSDPAAQLRAARRFLAPGGCIIAS